MTPVESESIIDLSALLAPIAGDNPAGEDVRYTLHDAIKEARRSDDGLAQGDWKHDAKASDWNAVIALSRPILLSKSKDLQVGVWLTEALVKKHAWRGLRDGFRLLEGLIAQFWASLYPALEDGDLDFRAGPLEALNQTLPFAIRNLPLTGPPDSYSWFSFDESRTTENVGRKDPGKKADLLAAGKLSSEQFDKAVGEKGRAFYEQLTGEIEQAWETFQQLDHQVDEKFGRAAPSLLDVKKALEDCRTLLATILAGKRKLEPDAVAEAAGNGADDTATPVASAGSGGAPAGPLTLDPRNRADAIRRLQAVATFFHRTEPHSPAAYLIERAAKWCDMPLEQWLQEVIRNDDVLNRLRETLGIKNQSG